MDWESKAIAVYNKIARRDVNTVIFLMREQGELVLRTAPATKELAKRAFKENRFCVGTYRPNVDYDYVRDDILASITELNRQVFLQKKSPVQAGD